MAMKYFDKKLHLSKELEMDIWREANMGESYGTSRYGLAFSALTRGFGANIFANVIGAGFVSKIEPIIGKVDYDSLALFLNERRKRCVKLGAKEEKIERITDGILRRVLSLGHVPVVLSNSEFFDAEDLPHWIVVCGIDVNRFYVNNPLDKVGPSSLPLNLLSMAIGYKGDHCMVTVSKHTYKSQKT